MNPDNVDLPSNISCTIPKVPDEPDEARCQLSEDVSKGRVEGLLLMNIMLNAPLASS